jgi:hypothetical protein
MKDVEPQLRIVPTPPDQPDKYAWDWLVIDDDGREHPVATIFCGTDLSTDSEYLPERLAEAIQSKGRAEVERFAVCAAAIKSIELRRHEPDLPIVTPRDA